VIDSVVTHHLNPFRSGVARFNALLAERLDVPLVPLTRGDDVQQPLLSFKASELGDGEHALVTERLPVWRPSLFLHEWGDTALERALVRAATRVLCGNAEIAAQVGGDLVWTPGLILESGRIPPTEVRVFTFGMAHKIRAHQFERLRDLLDASGRTWAVRVSAANHETATIGDAEAVFSEMRDIFGERVFFLGTLSDLAVAHELERATLFAAFFAGGVRANNTTVASAMERGAVVVTNLDAASPDGLRHLGNVIDIERTDALPTDPLLLRRISVGAMEFARARSWERLVEVVRYPP
jgi:hypothetical protein